jgi:peptidylprolyl isomerase
MKSASIAIIAMLLVSTGLPAQNSSSSAASKPSAKSSSTVTHAATAKAGGTQPWITTGSGLKYQDLVVGKGPQPKSGDDLLVNYTGRLQNGKVFDSSLSPGRTPFELHLGRGEVIPGWDQGLATMHVGGKRRLVIPPNLAYGAAGAGGVIPPNATLAFDVELLKIK